MEIVKRKQDKKTVEFKYHFKPLTSACFINLQENREQTVCDETADSHKPVCVFASLFPYCVNGASAVSLSQRVLTTQMFKKSLR